MPLPRHNACHLSATSLSWSPLCQGWERKLWSLLCRCKFSAFRVQTRASPEHSTDQTEAGGIKTHLIHQQSAFFFYLLFQILVWNSTTNISLPDVSLTLSFSFSLFHSLFYLIVIQSWPERKSPQQRRGKKDGRNEACTSRLNSCHLPKLGSSTMPSVYPPRLEPIDFCQFSLWQQGCGEREWGGTWQMKTERKTK